MGEDQRATYFRVSAGDCCQQDLHRVQVHLAEGLRGLQVFLMVAEEGVPSTVQVPEDLQVGVLTVVAAVAVAGQHLEEREVCLLSEGPEALVGLRRVLELTGLNQVVAVEEEGFPSQLTQVGTAETDL